MVSKKALMAITVAVCVIEQAMMVNVCHECAHGCPGVRVSGCQGVRELDIMCTYQYSCGDIDIKEIVIEK